VALLVEGRHEGLTALAASICAELAAAAASRSDGGGGGDGQAAGGVTALVVSNLIRELAVRKSYGVKDGARGAVAVRPTGLASGWPRGGGCVCLWLVGRL
jgi:hypothetical protein